MTQTITRRKAGAHRKRGKSIKSRIAMVALTSSAVSVSGAAATAAADDVKDTDKDLVAQEGSEAQLSTTPTVLLAHDFRPASDLGTQLATALQYNDARLAADRAARAPQLSVPALGAFTSGFGPRWGSFHAGIDIANVTNTPIMSVMDGTVVDSGPAQGYGQWIRVQHDDGAVSVYGHLESLGVAVGERVSAGQVIGGMGNRGFSTGTHLHFEIHPDGTTPVDPVSWFLQRGLDVVAGGLL
ncbi:M23 family metallopeptidase [uncultured Corynebacterium sp.]|uniref:M23 family metallopeptidase n=1 Tax=uncultured Corynebacterium sp. TaxID=159447 RepID=UPI0025E9AF0E|nr:M23 family metallopeptidase [uncultured Corynebacterium sp.]